MKDIGGAEEARDGALAFDADLGHPAPAGPIAAQGESNYRRAARALDAGRFEDAASLGRYTIEEAREGHELYAAWRDQIRRYLVREGVSPEIVAAEDVRLADLLRLDDGAPFDAARRWADYNSLIDAFTLSCGAGDGKRRGCPGAPPMTAPAIGFTACSTRWCGIWARRVSARCGTS
jgi:hypothetical protein